MYYNTNKITNDYYNSYKREIQNLENYEKQEKNQKVMKIIFMIAIMLLLGFTSYYVYRYFHPSIGDNYKIEKRPTYKNQLPSITISEIEELPKSPQLIALNNKKKTNISQQDIRLIVKIIMDELHKQKKLSLEEQLTAVESKTYIPKELKENNYYNKVILSKKEKKNNKNIPNRQLVELANNINHVIEAPNKDNILTEYSKAIKKELSDRKNEMCVIVVKKGDTLSRIAKRAYGDSNAYPKIFSANPEIIKNPDQIYEGMRLRIPS